MKYAVIFAAVAALAAPLGAADNSPAGGRHVAGSTPQQRPQGAPALRDVPGGLERLKAALAGISEPVPASLGFLDHQGAWYTPFDRPGMPGYYDIRRLHERPGNARP